MNNQHDVIVVGGGPAGMSAAIAAAERNARVMLLEHHRRPGTKLLLTGGSRCNISNTAAPAAFASAFEDHHPFVRAVLKAFGPKDLERFFVSQGLRFSTPDGFHLYPESRKAADVLAKLRDRMNRLGVQVSTRTVAENLVMMSGRTAGVATDQGEFRAHSVILATGGLSRTAGTDAARKAVRLCSDVGHKIIPCVPALVGLVTVEEWPRTLRGITLDTAVLRPEGRLKLKRMTPGVLFTHHGISGPAVLNRSGAIARQLTSGSSVSVRLVPDFRRDEQSRIEELLAAQRNLGSRTVRAILRMQMPDAVAETFCRILEVDEIRMGDLTKALRGKLATALGRGIPLTVSGTEGFEKSMATSGGVSISQVRSDTLESSLVPGLYFAGELLDVLGPCGGYNLQWAFSSGFLAGSSAAKAIASL